VLALKLGGGLSTAETAAVLGCSEHEVRLLQQQALTRLRIAEAEAQ
jgi:DNA-directed RNA polymerase specialized sigma24 family protein